MKKVTKDQTLLGEAMTRKFFKIANLGPLAENFISHQVTEEEEPEEELPPPAPEAAPAMAGTGEEEVKKLVDAIADAIEKVSGVEIGVEGHEATETPEEENAEHSEEGLPPPASDEVDVEIDEGCASGMKKPAMEESEKSAKMKPLKLPTDLKEKKLSISKDKIVEISRNIVERLLKESKK